VRAPWLSSSAYAVTDVVLVSAVCVVPATRLAILARSLRTVVVPAGHNDRLPLTVHFVLCFVVVVVPSAVGCAAAAVPRAVQWFPAVGGLCGSVGGASDAA
jgi:hypothetical protein